jgi:hypothetical protein
MEEEIKELIKIKNRVLKVSLNKNRVKLKILAYIENKSNFEI